MERVLDDKAALARRALVWQYTCYGARKLRRFTLRRGDYIGVNAPLALNPEILEDVLQLVDMPSGIRNRYRALALDQSNVDSKK